MASRSLAALLMLAGAACTTTGGRGGDGRSLIGTWMYVDLQTKPRPIDDCETDFAISFAADGTYSGYEEAGVWRIDGGDLIETVTQTWDMGGGPEAITVRNSVPGRVRLQWISTDVVNLVSKDPADGYGLIRCRPYRQY